MYYCAVAIASKYGRTLKMIIIIIDRLPFLVGWDGNYILRVALALANCNWLMLFLTQQKIVYFIDDPLERNIYFRETFYSHRLAIAPICDHHL